MVRNWRKTVILLFELKKRNFVNKTINRVVGANGIENCTNKGIKDECYRFYEKLYKIKETQSYQLQDFIKTNNFASLNEIQKHLDNNPGCTVSYIKSKLRNNFEELFI